MPNSGIKVGIFGEEVNTTPLKTTAWEARQSRDRKCNSKQITKK